MTTMRKTFAQRAALLTTVAALGACGGATAGGAEAGEAPAPSTSESGTAVSAGGRGPAVLYEAADTTVYVLQRQDSLTFQYQNNQSQTQRSDRTLFLRVAIGSEVGTAGRAFRVTLDSVRPDTTTPAQIAELLKQAEGTRWAGTIAANGELSDLAPSKASAMGDQMAGMFGTLFPVLPEGGARAGAEWTDPDTTTTKGATSSSSETSTTRYTAVGGDTVSGAPRGTRALAVRAETTTSESGTIDMGGQAMETQGSGVRRVRYVLAVDSGALLASEGTDSTSMTITVPALGQTVPVTRIGRFTLQRR